MSHSAGKKFDLSIRNALITGAADLLRLEYASALGQSGALVVLADLNDKNLPDAAARLDDAHGAGCRSTHVKNVTDEASISGVAVDLAAAGSRIDVVVNNATIDSKVTSGSSIDESSRLEIFPRHNNWDLQVAVGLTGSLLCCKAFDAAMFADGNAVILNIASDLAVIAPDQRLYRKDGLAEDQQPVKPVTYSVIKAGLVGLTRYLATYWIGAGVRANSLSSGGVYAGQGEEFVHKLTSLIPMGHMTARDEYHAAIQFRCSDASAYMNGQNVIMDGGRSVW